MTLDEFINTLREKDVQQLDVTYNAVRLGNSNEEGNHQMVTFTWPGGKAVLTNQSGSWKF
jgi:hypothetical protein